MIPDSYSSWKDHSGVKVRYHACPWNLKKTHNVCAFALKKIPITHILRQSQTNGHQYLHPFHTYNQNETLSTQGTWVIFKASMTTLPRKYSHVTHSVLWIAILYGEIWDNNPFCVVLMNFTPPYCVHTLFTVSCPQKYPFHTNIWTRMVQHFYPGVAPRAFNS